MHPKSATASVVDAAKYFRKENGTIAKFNKNNDYEMCHLVLFFHFLSRPIFTFITDYMRNVDWRNALGCLDFISKLLEVFPFSPRD